MEMQLVPSILQICPIWLVWKEDRKSTRLNSSHANISYAVFCLKKKNNVRSSSHNIYMGENSFEALFRALYLDRGDNDCIIFLHNRTLYILIIIYKESYK